MIKKSELRIGNIYQYRDKSYTNFGQIKSGAEIDEMEDSSFEPVELTPEILEKAGFIKIEENVWKKWYLLLTKHESDWDEGFITLVNDFILQNTLYVHQLQNLFFALSGEELTITL